MRTLIIPCAGSRMNDGIPLFLTEHPKGEINAVQALKGIYPENYDKIIFTVLESTDHRFNAEQSIISCVNNRWAVDILKLKNPTNGPAETVYETLRQMGIEDSFVVRDSHGFILLDKDYTGNVIAGLDLTHYERTIDKLRSKSFITMNEQGQVLDIVEKHFNSDIISTGLYGFKSVEDFKLAYEHLQDPAYGIKKLYISHIISYLIGYKQRVFHAALVKEFEDWSTPAAWQKTQKKYGLYFVDIDSVTVHGIDGEIKIEEKAVRALQRLLTDGAEIVGVIRDKRMDNQIRRALKQFDIQINHVINVDTVSGESIYIGNKDALERAVVEL